MSGDYDTEGLCFGDLHPDPLIAFGHWFSSASGVVIQHDAVVLATAYGGGPSARTVLLRGYDREGFISYTN